MSIYQSEDANSDRTFYKTAAFVNAFYPSLWIFETDKVYSTRYQFRYQV